MEELKKQVLALRRIAPEKRRDVIDITLHALRRALSTGEVANAYATVDEAVSRQRDELERALRLAEGRALISDYAGFTIGEVNDLARYWGIN